MKLDKAYHAEGSAMHYDPIIEALQKENAALRETHEELKNEFELSLDVAISKKEYWEEGAKALQSKLDKAVKALEKCKHLTFCWVIAEETVNCKHTYEDIRKVVTEALEDLRSGRTEGALAELKNEEQTK